MRIINMRPPRIGMALTFIASVFHWSLNIGETTRFALPWTGAFIGIAGFFLMMWSWWLFKEQNLAICLPAKTAHITKAGPYRFSRNPMYLGFVLMMLGLALYIGTLPFYLSAIAYFTILNFVFCHYEENKLENAFADEYIQYRNRVRRWI
jgi:protein-S-isoprenylcysteine O-methyltransferase Ste14